jgi:hypothetical protein
MKPGMIESYSREATARKSETRRKTLLKSRQLSLRG